jgi:hypothetical protein
LGLTILGVLQQAVFSAESLIFRDWDEPPVKSHIKAMKENLRPGVDDES